MTRFKMNRCETCSMRTMFTCYYCSAPCCQKHRLIDESNRLICNGCSIKFYKMWIEEKDELHTTELRYLEWLKQQIEKEASIG